MVEVKLTQFSLLMIAICLHPMCSLLQADEAVAEDWIPVEARHDSPYDWMQLSSGEWLKGEFLHLYEDSVAFDSDVLGDLDIDWEDVRHIRFSTPVGVRLNNRTVRTGNVFLGEDSIVFIDQDISIPKRDIVSIAPVRDSELSLWEVSGRVGLDFQSGNTNETRYMADLSATRSTVSTRFRLGYLANFSKTDGVESTDNDRASTVLDLFVDERLFIRALDGEYYRDPFQNIKNQFTLGGGVGYKVIDVSDFAWEVQFGPAYQYTEFSQVEEGTSNSSQGAAAVFSTLVNYDITSDLEFTLRYQGVLTQKESGLFTQHLVSSLDYELTKIFDVFFQLQFDRIEKPREKSDGVAPEKNDLILSFGLGVDL